MTISWADLAGFVAVVTNILGNLLVARLNVWGWPVRIASNVAWAVYVIWVPSTPVLLNAIVFCGINVYGWRKWRRDRRLNDG